MIPFSKYEGLGNDFIIFNNLEGKLSDVINNLNKQFIKKLCDRHLGVGSDGLIIAQDSDNQSDLTMDIYNSDGTQAEMCGNGIRCLIKYIIDKNLFPRLKSFKINTLSGIIVSEYTQKNLIRVNMGKPYLNPEDIPTYATVGVHSLPEGSIELNGYLYQFTAVGMGNPHMVIIVKSLNDINIEILGPKLEKSDFFPAQTNVHFVEIVNPNMIKMKVWERGSGITKACGTGACAVLVACKMQGLCDNYSKILLPGGELSIDWPKKDSSVFMEGPANHVFNGSYPRN